MRGVRRNVEDAVDARLLQVGVCEVCNGRKTGVAEDSFHGVERILAPTLIVSAEDDLFRTLPGARFTAEHISHAELNVLKRGGPPMVGPTTKVRTMVRDFLARRRKLSRSDRGPRRPAQENCSRPTLSEHLSDN